MIKVPDISSELEMQFINNALYNILSRKNEFCCLCFESDGCNLLSIYDEIELRTKPLRARIKFSELLSHLLGNETYNNVSTFNMVCEQCMKLALNCYTFIEVTKENSKQLCNTLQILFNYFENGTPTVDDCQSLFINVDTENFTSQQFYDSKELTKPSQASGLKRFQSIINSEKTKWDNKSELPMFVMSSSKTFKKLYRKENKISRHKYKVPTSQMLYNQNRNDLKCKECLKDFPSLSNLRNHYIRVHAPKTFKCQVCDRKFGSQSLLDAHKKESHCILVCKECGKTFYNRHTLRMHEMGHKGRKLVCQDCGRIYKSHTTFKKHIELNVCGQKTRANPAEAKFTCDHCNKKYTQKVSLRVHIQHEHGTYKSHECKWCKKKFWAQSRLKAHIVKHTQEKKFHCDMCGGKFVTKESLLYHTRTHTGEKPYKCEQCESRFLSASRRAEHIKHHHLNATLECDVCHCKFKTQMCLQKHKKVHLDTNYTKKFLKHVLVDNLDPQITDNKVYFEVTDNCEEYNTDIRSITL